MLLLIIEGLAQKKCLIGHAHTTHGAVKSQRGAQFDDDQCWLDGELSRTSRRLKMDESSCLKTRPGFRRQRDN